MSKRGKASSVNKKKKSPFHLTFEDALDAAVSLAKQKQHQGRKTWRSCTACKETINILSETKKRLIDAAYGNNLVWYAYKGQRRVRIDGTWFKHVRTVFGSRNRKRK